MRGSVPLGLTKDYLEQPDAFSQQGNERNVLRFRQQTTRPDLMAALSDESWPPSSEIEQATPAHRPPPPQAGESLPFPPQQYPLLDDVIDHPLEPLSARLTRVGTPENLDLVHADMLGRYAEAEAEQTEEADTDWYASRIAGDRSWASMETSLDTLIEDFEKRHRQANIYVAGGIGGAVVLTLIGLSAFLTLSG